MPDRILDDGTKIQALTLSYAGVPVIEISKITGISRSQIYKLRTKAEERGYNAIVNPILRLEHVVDAPRSGRPKEMTEEKTAELVSLVSKTRDTREYSLEEIALVMHTSSSTIHRVLKKLGYNKYKPTMKPGLTEAMKTARFLFAKSVENWTLEDWKKVIWSDETSIILGHRRGSVRVWRRTEERQDKTCIRRRWKGASEFMFWGCFSWNKRGPCHIWKPETARQKKEAAVEIERRNKETEPQDREKWELEVGLRRMGLRNKPGRKPIWTYTAKHGALVRDAKKGGIDWWRYQLEILLPKLIPFAIECQQDFEDGDVWVQEDNAPSHTHKAQQIVFDLYKVRRILWPGNSPDLNAIEPAWPYLKRATTRKGAPRNRKEAEKAWLQAWKAMPQPEIQRWIERIPIHIQEIIRLRGGNEYTEGKSFFDAKEAKRQAASVRRAAYRARRETGDEDQWEDFPDTENQKTGLGLQPTRQEAALHEQLQRADLQLLWLQSEKSSDESSDDSSTS